jgi:GNAT superfamily N-acetyltransferase
VVVNAGGVTDLVVRPAIATDREQIARLAAVEGAADRFDALLTDPTRYIVVADVGGILVGFAETQFYGMTLRRPFGVTRMHDLVVDEAHRRRGIGSALLDAVEGWAAAIPECRYLEWQSSPSAVAFYRARGLVANEYEDSDKFPYFVIDMCDGRGQAGETCGSPGVGSGSR